MVLALESAPLMTVMSGFEDLYRLENPGLLAVATAMTGDERDGEDLVQDTMVKTPGYGDSSRRCGQQG